MTNGRSVLLKVTAFDGGVVVVEGANGKPSLLPADNDVTRVLHEIANDPSQPEMTSSAKADVPTRLLALAERYLTGGDQAPPHTEG